MNYLFLALALVVLSARPAHRILAHGTHPITPRDGPEMDIIDVADDIALFAVSLRAGLPIGEATRAVASAAGSATIEVWQRVAGLIAIGVTYPAAFAEVDDLEGFDELARLIARSANNGHAIAASCEELAHSLRDRASDHAIARAERAGVLIALPLTGCFLPAFLILGLAPVIYSLATDLF